ncbi:hypothetical protein Tco_0339390 [Tanacetum coccineum]
MTTLKFVYTHNMVVFLAKPAESEGLEQIDIVKVKTVNGEVQLQALVDGKKIIITESTVRRDLQLEDVDGVDCLPNATIFEQLTLMGYEKISQKLTFYKAFFSPQWKFLIHTILQCLSSKTTAWNEFSSTMKSTIICLATNQKFNFSKYIFESMVKNLDNVGLSGRETPLFQTIVVQDQAEIGEGSAIHDDPYYTPTFIQPSTSQPQMKQRSKRPKRKDTQVPQSSVPSDNVADEAANEEMDDSLVKVATDRGNINKTRSKATLNEPSSSGNSSGNGPRVVHQKGLSSEDEGLGEEDASKREDTDIDANKDIYWSICFNTAEETESSVQHTTTLHLQSTTATTTIIADIIRPKAKGIVFHEQEQAPTPKFSSQQPSQVKRKRSTSKEVNIAWDDVQAKIKANYQLAQRLQAQEQEELIDEEKVRLFVQFLEQRRKHFAAKRAEEKSTTANKSSQSSKKAEVEIAHESSLKRAREELEQESSKKQKLEEDKESEELKKCLEIVPDDRDDVTIDATPLSTKSLTIVDYKIYKEEKKSYFPIIRVDDNVWKNQQGLVKVLNWKLYDSCGVHCVTMQSMLFYLLVEKMYPLINHTLHQMFNDVKLQFDYECEMAFELFRLVNK